MTLLIVKHELELDPFCDAYPVRGIVTPEQCALDAGLTVDDAYLYAGYDHTASGMIQDMKLDNDDLYEEVADDAFTADEIRFNDGFDVVTGTASWSIERARPQLKRIARRVYKNIIDDLFREADYSEATVIVQASLAEGDRIAGVQDLMDLLNTKSVELASVYASIDAATGGSDLATIENALPEDPSPLVT